MVKSIQYQRLCTLIVFLTIGFTGLAGRLVYLQVIRHDDLAAKALSNTEVIDVIPALRGTIVDCNNNPLAVSRFANRVVANPMFIHPYASEVADAIAGPLGMDPDDLESQLRLVLKTNRTTGDVVTNQYRLLHRNLSDDAWMRVRSALANLDLAGGRTNLSKDEHLFFKGLRSRGIYAETTQAREYPHGSRAAPVLGLVTEVNHRDAFGESVLPVGRAGIEKSFNNELTGINGWLVTERDAGGNELAAFRSQKVEPTPGARVVLTIDLRIQDLVERELQAVMEEFRPASASAVVMEPRTGRILGMASLPSFDPGDLSTFKPEQARNRLISTIIEPGSTFKIVPLAAALAERKVSLTTPVHCEGGHYRFAGRYLNDHHSYDLLSVEEVLAKSSNIGTAKIALRLGHNLEESKDILYRYIRKFGFGRRTGLPLPGEQKGIVYPPHRWSKLQASRVPIGQGVGVTPLQMVMAMAAIANRGVLMQPMVVDRLEDATGRVLSQYPSRAVATVLDERSCESMVRALTSVVSTNGTARRAQLDYFTVAGKTGTAQKPMNGHYPPGKYVGSFIGFFPAENPAVCIGIFVDEPEPGRGYYGSVVAVPAFRNIAGKLAGYLNIQSPQSAALRTVSRFEERRRSGDSQPPSLSARGSVPAGN